MGVRMCWHWDPDGVATADFDTIEAAADALAGSARRTYHRYDQHPQRDTMLACITPLTERMLSEGAARITAGESWSGRCGGVQVTLSPRCPGGLHRAP